MKKKFDVYINRYRLLAEEMRDTVNNAFKPQVLGAINIGKKI